MELTLARRSGRPIAWFVGLALIGIVGAFYIGLIDTLGYESRRVTFSGLASGTKSSSGFGLKRMLLFRGQTFYADYDVEVRQGSFRIGILKTFGPIGDKPHYVKSITESGSGEVTFEIPETGLYSMYFEGSVLGGKRGRGYDVSYSVLWGAR